MSSFDQFPRRDKWCCLEDDLTGFQPLCWECCQCACASWEREGVCVSQAPDSHCFFSKMSPCWIVTSRETHWPWWSQANTAERTVWLGMHSQSPCLCASHSSALAQCCMQWHWVMPAIPMIDEWLEALSTQAGIWSRHRIQHCPGERIKGKDDASPAEQLWKASQDIGQEGGRLFHRERLAKGNFLIPFKKEL